MGALMPEALAAWEELSADVPGLGLLAVTSPDLLHRGWTRRAGRALGGQPPAEPCRDPARPPRPRRRPGHLVRRRPRLAVAGSAACSASASRRSGVDRFGQTGNLADLYAAYRLDGAAITEAVAELLLPA